MYPRKLKLSLRACRMHVFASFRVSPSFVITSRVHPSASFAFPRLRMKQQFAETCCRLVTAKPETSYDNFLRDFGERFVPGYKIVSTVDLLINAPFDE